MPAGPTISPAGLGPCDLQALRVRKSLIGRCQPPAPSFPEVPRLSGPRPPIPSCLALWDPREAADPRIQAPGQARACRRHHFLVGGAGLPSAPSGQDALSVPSASFMEECDTGLSSPPLSPLGTQLSGSPVTSSNRGSEIQGPLALSSLRDHEPPQFPGSPRAQESRHLFPPFSSRAHQL